MSKGTYSPDFDLYPDRTRGARIRSRGQVGRPGYNLKLTFSDGEVKREIVNPPWQHQGGIRQRPEIKIARYPKEFVHVPLTSKELKMLVSIDEMFR